jgi:hypothetical protein
VIARSEAEIIRFVERRSGTFELSANGRDAFHAREIAIRLRGGETSVTCGLCDLFFARSLSLTERRHG